MSENGQGGYWFAVFLAKGCIQVGVVFITNEGECLNGFLVKTFGKAQGNLGESLDREVRKQRKEDALSIGAKMAEASGINMHVDWKHF